MDGDVWKIFESEVYSLISKPQTKQPVEVLAQSVAGTIFDGLIHNNISERLLKIYYKCVDSNSMREPLLNYIEKYKIPQGVSVLDTHPDHCLIELDRLFSSNSVLHWRTMNILSDSGNMSIIELKVRKQKHIRLNG